MLYGMYKKSDLSKKKEVKICIPKEINENIHF